MTRREIRRQVVERERRVKQLRADGWTCAEIAEELGVSTQRVYDFLGQARRRRPVLSVADRLHVDEDVRRKLATKKLRVAGNQTQFANLALQELEQILIATEFSTYSIGGDVTQVQITKCLRRPTPRPGVDNALAKLRRSIAEHKRVTLLKWREFGPDRERIKWQVWTFVFSKT